MMPDSFVLMLQECRMWTMVACPLLPKVFPPRCQPDIALSCSDVLKLPGPLKLLNYQLLH